MSDDDDIFYVIIWKPNGALDVAEVQWFDLYDYDLASERHFVDEKEAINYAVTRAASLGYEYEGPKAKGMID